MDIENDSCINCGQPLGLLETDLEEEPVEVPGKGSLCPRCYKRFTTEEYRNYFA